ncbi:MAG: hypothetical protein M0041_03530 [Nitrospiraceae bacterium]|jgi:hypothetical protein|nr:hypothetical protein [Nitrospiraceae bacterium]
MKEADTPLRFWLLTLFWMWDRLLSDGRRLYGAIRIYPEATHLMGILYECGPMMMRSLRDHSPTDRRASIVEPTPKAEDEFCSENCSAFKDRVSRIFDVFSEKEQEQFLDFLLRMRTVMIEPEILDEKSRTIDAGNPWEPIIANE